ncbi:VacJ family lipoprotein [Acinetobacter sp. NCu2D-2]|uniref:MlaA family lipoprotein n=1 Tax=Acinetobacter sp. NCu2D-2 TaxID=1608473 RepID=UPI0007CDA6B9|nr:VacJ family lipoprotein [Acinetobacter sp. NCu2D-2]ANF82448.1 VacJ family lipoprotein [Acinetobacter sp. NCu2D-2]
MRLTSYLYISLFSVLSLSSAWAADESQSNLSKSAKIKERVSTNIQHLKEQINVDANAAQSDEVKDPFQAINRKIYGFNDVLDQNIARPLAVQYVAKFPSDVRDSARLFRKNLGEPWNALNQLMQGRLVRSAQTLGRFSINTITTLGLADVATHFGLPSEEEDFGTTLGYFGVPSGPYVMLPVLGPSSFRDTVGRVVDSQARPQKYILEDHDEIYYPEQIWRGIDARSQVLDIDQVLQGDKYAQLRDIYLQRQSFTIAQKKGLEEESLFRNDDFDTEDFEEDSSESIVESSDEAES